MKRLFNSGWRFHEFAGGTEIGEVFEYIENDGAFEAVDIPHDYMIYDVKNLYRTSVGVYVKDVVLDASKNNTVYFEGVYMRTTVYLNGEEIFFWPYGYTSFEVDLTPYQKEGDNRIIVFVDYRCPNTRWYSGAGIFRDVWLYDREKEHILTNGVYFNAVKSDDDTYKMTVDTEVVGKRGEKLTILQELLDADGNIVFNSSDAIEANTEPTIYTITADKLKVKQWDIQSPYLYSLRTRLMSEKGIVDEIINKVGFRTIMFDPDKGFLLNDRVVKIQGACMHHDLGALGAAFNKCAAKRQIEELKKMGVNAIRTSHNPPAVGLMELCDKMGILVDSDAFDMWERPKTENDYGIFFHDWVERDVESWIRRDRNHPSVIMWSVGNEIPDTNDISSVKIAKRLIDAVRRNDYRHNAFTTLASNYVAWENAQKVQDLFEVSGYNYLESVYDEHHQKFKHWCIYGSETASTVQSRGIYHFPKANRLLTYEDIQCSSLDNCSTNWGAKNVHKFVADHRDRDYVAGQFIWTGWDYIGEPTPYFTKNSYFGHIDTAGFWKDTAYIIKAGWVDYKKDPFVHIGIYWDFNKGQRIDIPVYSNAPFVELFFEDESLGEVRLDQKKDDIYSAYYSLDYKEGKLRAVAYDEHKNIIAEDVIESFGDPSKVVLKADKTSLKADGEDLIFIEINTVDKEGRYVADSRSRVKIEVEGPARLLGLDNGDSTDYEEYKINCRKLFSGKLLVILGAGTETGMVKVKATSKGLESGELCFDIVAADTVRDGVSCQTRVVSCAEDNSKKLDIPSRKLEMTLSPDVRVLNKELPEVKVNTQILPVNSDCREIEYKALTSDGIESRAVEIIREEESVTLKAVSDGSFRLLAFCKNEKEHADIISEMEFAVEGIGSKNHNPYEMVYGCEFNDSFKDAQLSFRGSINFHTDNCICFRNVDFGDYGSDELHLSLFSFRDEEPVEILVDDPEKGDTVFKGVYNIPTVYNVLQEDVFKLNKRLKGIRDIFFKFENGLVLGGFYMTKFEKAYSYIEAVEYQMITGDSFEVKEDGIYGIGNNVDMEYTGMNFSKGVSKVTIKGRARKTVCPVHIRFFSGDDVVKKVVEFPVKEEITEETFMLGGFSGEGKIDIIFLPGADFDLIGFKFDGEE
ncbi:MAG: DUF4982 domain-containing protein [Eubacterium sp.]|nr:DUF4982 domain-containing protein [Eubacterium sp.]